VRFTLGCWAVAIALVYSKLDLVEGYASFPPAFADITFPLALVGYLSLKILVGWSLLFLLAGVLPYLLWSISLKEVSLVVALLAALFMTPGGGGFSSFADRVPFALTIAVIYWVGQRDTGIERWFYCIVPLGTLALCALGYIE
jgi:hypothetical protein